jgi:hypothetical protein
MHLVTTLADGEDAAVGSALHRLAFLGLAAGATLWGTACSGPPPGAPSPVIVATPTTVCLGDGYKTPITLDGTQSSPELTLVPLPAVRNPVPLKFLWTLTGSAYRIAEGGSLTSDKLSVTIAGDQPLQVDLNVQNAQSGGSADSTTTISVTLPNDAGVCPLGNPG